MTWAAIFTAGLPEHLLLAGIVALVILEIVAGEEERASRLATLLEQAAAPSS